MKDYQAPIVEIKRLACLDILTVSNGESADDMGKWNDGWFAQKED